MNVDFHPHPNESVRFIHQFSLCTSLNWIIQYFSISTSINLAEKIWWIFFATFATNKTWFYAVKKNLVLNFFVWTVRAYSSFLCECEFVCLYSVRVSFGRCLERERERDKEQRNRQRRKIKNVDSRYSRSSLASLQSLTHANKAFLPTQRTFRMFLSDNSLYNLMCTYCKYANSIRFECDKRVEEAEVKNKRNWRNQQKQLCAIATHNSSWCRWKGVYDVNISDCAV